MLGCLAAPGSGAGDAAGAEPLLEGRVLLSSGAPAAGARVRLFADLERSLRATADESGYFALSLNALRKGRALCRRACSWAQNYPNPFNPSTIIPYQLPAPARVRLEVFNILGQRVATLVDGERPAGFHTAIWDATDASGRGVGSGVYLYRLLGGGERLTRSMVLLDGPVVAAGGGGSGGAADPWGGTSAGRAGGVFGGASDPSDRIAGAGGPTPWSGAAGTAGGPAPGSGTAGGTFGDAAGPADGNRRGGGGGFPGGRHRLSRAGGGGLRGCGRSIRQARRSKRCRSGEVGSGQRSSGSSLRGGESSGSDRRDGSVGFGPRRRGRSTG